MANFENEQENNRRRSQDLQTIQELQSGASIPIDQLNEKTINKAQHKTPLKSVRQHPAVYYSRMVPQNLLSPITMSNENPKKYFMSGYTGFVPRARGKRCDDC